MGFSDIIKSSILDSYYADFSYIQIGSVLFWAAALSVYVFFIYRIVTRKTFYSKTMNISLAAISIVTASIILTIQSNLIISLGMVGALSIVRFRTAIKDPMDLFFLFWSISIGIICGAGLSKIAVITSVILTILIFVLNWVPVAKAPLLLVVNATGPECEGPILEAVGKYAKHYTVKSQSLTTGSMDMVLELRTKQGAECLKVVGALEGVTSACLLQHDGEVTF